MSRLEKRRVILNIPQDLRMELQALRERADSLGFSLMGETFPQWLLRFLRDWSRRERRRMRRLERELLRQCESEAHEEDARRD